MQGPTRGSHIVFSSIAEAVIVADAKGRVSFTNAAVRDLTRWGDEGVG